MKINDNLIRVKPQGIKAHRDFLLRCLEENQELFRQRLYECASEDPKFFLKIYTEISKHLVPHQQDVNVNLTLNQDFQALQALASTGKDDEKLLQYEAIGPPALESLAPSITLDTPPVNLDAPPIDIEPDPDPPRP